MSDGRQHRPSLPSTVVFDLDGTLVDSARDIAAALNEVLAGFRLVPFPVAEVVDFIGDGIPALLTKAFAARGIHRDANELVSSLSEFQSIYSRCLIDTTRPYPGLTDLLDRLIARGVRLGVCTNKEEKLANRILDGLGLLKRIDVVVGGMPGRPSKPSPVPLEEAIARLGGEPRHAIMVGDSIADLTCAKNAGVRFIGISFGYSRIPLVDLGAEIVIDDYFDFESACDCPLAER